MSAHDGRRHASELVLNVRHEGGHSTLTAPRPGFYRGAPAPDTVLAPGMIAGELEVLGVRFRLLVPHGAHGAVLATGHDPSSGTKPRRLARRPVAAGDALVVLGPARQAGASSGALAESAQGDATGLAFRAPMGGRYYARPSPQAAVFVEVGDILEAGRTIALLEVMKTFHRVQYGGAAMPERARVLAVVPKDGDDVGASDTLLRLEPA